MKLQRIRQRSRRGLLGRDRHSTLASRNRNIATGWKRPRGVNFPRNFLHDNVTSIGMHSAGFERRCATSLPAVRYQSMPHRVYLTMHGLYNRWNTVDFADFTLEVRFDCVSPQ